MGGEDDRRAPGRCAHPRNARHQRERSMRRWLIAGAAALAAPLALAKQYSRVAAFDSTGPVCRRSERLQHRLVAGWQSRRPSWIYEGREQRRRVRAQQRYQWHWRHGHRHEWRRCLRPGSNGPGLSGHSDSSLGVYGESIAVKPSRSLASPIYPMRNIVTTSGVTGQVLRRCGRLRLEHLSTSASSPANAVGIHAKSLLHPPLSASRMATPASSAPPANNAAYGVQGFAYANTSYTTLHRRRRARPIGGGYGVYGRPPRITLSSASPRAETAVGYGAAAGIVGIANAAARTPASSRSRQCRGIPDRQFRHRQHAKHHRLRQLQRLRGRHRHRQRRRRQHRPLRLRADGGGVAGYFNGRSCPHGSKSAAVKDPRRAPIASSTAWRAPNPGSRTSGGRTLRVARRSRARSRLSAV